MNPFSRCFLAIPLALTCLPLASGAQEIRTDKPLVKDDVVFEEMDGRLVLHRFEVEPWKDTPGETLPAKPMAPRTGAEK